MANKSTTPTKVQFPEELPERPHILKHVATQRYDRKEISKRLEIEQWMDGQLKILFETEEYPQLDLDDVLEIDESQRERKLQDYLKQSKKPAEDFIRELLEKAATVKYMKNTL